MYISYTGDAANTPLERIRTQVWLKQPNKARQLSGLAGGAPTRLWISDGSNQQENGGAVTSLPPIAQGDILPPSLPSDGVTLHPFAGLMGSVLGEFIFSTGLAQRTGEVHLVAKEIYAGRRTLVLEYFCYPDGPVIDRIWPDAL